MPPDHDDIAQSGAEMPNTEPLERELAWFFGYSNDLLAILDDRGIALALSPSFRRLLGHDPGTIAGRHMLRLVCPGDRKRAKARARELSPDRRLVELDAGMLRADGDVLPIRWSLSLGGQGRIYAVGHDQTDRARRKEAVLGSELAELRLRTAMELHDGILQTLTGASLQIAVARRLVKDNPVAAEGVLATLAETISAEQQEMRLYVDEVKGQNPLWSDAELGIRERTAAMLDQVRAIWGVDVSLDTELDHDLPPEICRQVVRVIQEATVNAARHGGAQSISVGVGLEKAEIAIRIRDDGHGFPFLGNFDTEALHQKRLGPVSLKHRVDRCGGRISITSTTEGATVSVWLPAGMESAP